MKNQKGVSILFVFFVIAVLAGLYPILTDLLPSLYKSTATQGQQEYMTSFIQSVGLELSDGVSCAAALGGVNIDPTQLNALQEVSINIGYGGTPGPIVAGWNLSPTIQLSHVYLQLLQPVIDPTTNAQRVVTLDFPWGNLTGPSTSPLNKFSANIILIPQNFNWNPNLDPPYRKIPLFVNIVAGGTTIVQCHGPTSAAEACEAVMYGAYDGVNSPYSPTDYRCNPDKICFNSTLGVVSDPTQCISPYQSQQMSESSYLCTWCNHNHP